MRYEQSIALLGAHNAIENDIERIKVLLDTIIGKAIASTDNANDIVILAELERNEVINSIEDTLTDLRELVEEKE
ncbi:hypothetical protein [Veillonella caviae]|uniref:hypothetical protein n=1 Tax=Veillonella caviae TaxID=248316 RepID=UPI0023F3EC6E|nr:hypothetical protein [Veillonella caviae]MCI6407673.1 hypothetical protein [Veillonella caviae]MDY6225795.1 hypothetical protein [Veillonella caviae]